MMGKKVTSQSFHLDGFIDYLKYQRELSSKINSCYPVDKSIQMLSKRLKLNADDHPCNFS